MTVERHDREWRDKAGDNEAERIKKAPAFRARASTARTPSRVQTSVRSEWVASRLLMMSVSVAPSRSTLARTIFWSTTVA